MWWGRDVRVSLTRVRVWRDVATAAERRAIVGDASRRIFDGHDRCVRYVIAVSRVVVAIGTALFGVGGCVDFGAGFGNECNTDSDCSAGRACDTFLGARCVPTCSSNSAALGASTRFGRLKSRTRRLP